MCVCEAKLKTIPTVQELSEQGKNLLAEGKQYAEVHRIVYYCGETIPFSFTLMISYIASTFEVDQKLVFNCIIREE